VIVEEAPAAAASGGSRPWQLLVLSARAPAALEAATSNLASFLSESPAVCLADVASTHQRGRKHFEHRLAVVADDGEDAARALSSRDPGRVMTSSDVPGCRPIAFLFPGEGMAFVGRARELYRSEPVFRRSVDECRDAMTDELHLDLRKLLHDEGEEFGRPVDGRDRARADRLPLLVIEYALARLWMSWGVHPQALIGHGVGEYVAACLAGVFSLGAMLSLVSTQARMMEQLPRGAMLAVSLPEEEVLPLLREGLSLGAVDATDRCVVSGTEDAIERLAENLAERKIPLHRIATGHALHSPMMEPIASAFAAEVSRVGPRPPSIPVVSCATGDWLKPEEASSPRYWAGHLARTVRFADGLRVLLADPARVLLEVGPDEALTSISLRHPGRSPQTSAIPSLPRAARGQSDLASLLTALGRLWLSGITVDWDGFSAQERRRRIPLPTYPFLRSRHWLEPERHPDPADGGSTFRSCDEDWGAPGLSDDGSDSHVEESQVVDQPASAIVEPASVAVGSPGDPRTPTEAIVAWIWGQALGVPRVGTHDNFYELGGDSLHIIHIVSRLNEILRVDLPLLSMMESPTVAALSECIESMYRIEFASGDVCNGGVRAEDRRGRRECATWPAGRESEATSPRRR
jgi:acyl transferase domain-containing protein